MSVFICLASFLAMAQSAGKAAPIKAPIKATSATNDAQVSSGDKAGQASLKKAKTNYQSGQFKEAADRLSRLAKQSGKSALAEEALVMLADVELRLNHTELAAAAITRFRRYFESSNHFPRMLYYQGHVSLRQGKNGDAAKAFASAAATATNKSLYALASKALWHLVDNGGLSTEDLEASLDLLDHDFDLKAQLLERIGDQYLREGRNQAARNTFEDWLEKFGKISGASRIKSKLKQAIDAPQQNRTVLLMAPMTGEYQEIGKSLKEGALLAIEEIMPAALEDELKPEFSMTKETLSSESIACAKPCAKKKSTPWWDPP
jgi:predicted negative regulator of RcsB-dependent stress response